jgi:CTP:molybdopterin cytidylyltransferase MocA
MLVLGPFALQYSGSMRTTSARRPRLAALVLAAGGSSRLGRPKQLIRLRGEPLLLRACRMASAVADGDVIVVLGAGALRLRSMLRRHRLDLRLVNNARWRDGMAGSLRAGLARVPRGTDGLLIALVDQARVESDELAELVRHWRRRPGHPAAAGYRGHAGVPAVLPRRLFRDLRTLEGDTGARQLLSQANGVRLLAMPSAAFDVDTPGDAAVLRRNEGKAPGESTLR